MSRHHFLGSTDLSVTTSLLTNYNVPTRIPDRIELNQIRQQNDLMLIQLGMLLTADECDEIVANVNQRMFEEMNAKYDVQRRNNSRLIVIDDRLARTVWRRLKFSNQLTKLIKTTQPLGFNVQGQWEMSGVNPAMRLNQYHVGEYFAPHKDAQYAPNGDERSLFSLIIYLNDDYQGGQTKFYFPKVSPKTDVKGLTIREEINAYGGLQNGYECVTIEPKKGHAILFTHNLLHEAVPPKRTNTPRFVLRTDVVVKRTDRPLGFAVCPEEEEDYFACLNFFREAQTNELNELNESMVSTNTTATGELYERSLSIRYCYPRLLESKRDQLPGQCIDSLPPEMWLYVFKYLHEQDMDNFIFAYPQFQPLKLIWDARESEQLNRDLLQPKFIPTIHAQYGTETLFCFPDASFFDEHVNQCCRVAAVYAFFLLGHGKDSTTYTVRYDRNTQQTSEVQQERILADVFYNRHCYGSLYTVEQKDKDKRNPTVDFDHSVDRTYMTNRHQAQFTGQDLQSNFYLNIIGNPSHLHKNGMDISITKNHILCHQRRDILSFQNEKLVETPSSNDLYEQRRTEKSPILCYREQLLQQTKQESGASLCRMLSAKDNVVDGIQGCFAHDVSIGPMRNIIRVYNHLIFDFNTHQLTVERLPERAQQHSYGTMLSKCVRLLQESVPADNRITYYRINIEKLARTTQGFNHASCQCSCPRFKVDQFSFFDYTYLSHVHLSVAQNADHVFVLATYGGITAL